MTVKERARWLTGAVAVLLAAGCARSQLYYGYSEGEGGDAQGGNSAGTSYGKGGTSPTAGTTPTGGRPSGGTGGTSGGSVGKGGTSGTSGSSGSGGSVVLGPICPSLAQNDAERVTLSFVTQGELMFVRASGSMVRVNANALGGDIYKKGEFLFLNRLDLNGRNVSLVDRAGNVLWLHVAEFDPITESEVWVSEEGNAAFVTPDARIPSVRGIAVTRNGELTNLLNTPLGPPNMDGWVPIGDHRFWGLQNIFTGETRSASLPSISGHRPFAWRDSVIQLAADVNSNVVSVVSPSGHWTFPIPPIDIAIADLVPTEFGALLTERGMPRAVLNGDSLELRDLGVFPNEGDFDVFCYQSGEWGLVVAGEIPRYRVNLRTANTTLLSSEPNLTNAGPALVQMNERWATLANENGYPLFRVDLVGPVAERIDFAPAIPLRVLSTPCPKRATEPKILDDGRVAIALRNETAAAAYVGHPNQFPWTLVGRPVAGIAGLGIDPRSGAWILDTSGAGTACSPFDADELPEGTEFGNMVQIVMDENVVVFGGHSVDEFVFHETGLCGFARSLLHDFPTGITVAFPSDTTHLMFW